MTTIPETLGAKSPAQAATKPAGAMDQSDFLRLMTTQMTTQDPFNPMDNTQMVAQMAQFSQVAGIAEMNASLKALIAGMGGNRITDAANWIGKSVLVAADAAAAQADGSYAGEVALPEGADSITVSLVDATGAVQHTQSFGPQKPGTLAFEWDGKNAAGEAVAGPLKIVVNATLKGEEIAPATASWATVAGIQSPASGADSKLLTGLGALSPEDALRLA